MKIIFNLMPKRFWNIFAIGVISILVIAFNFTAIYLIADNISFLRNSEKAYGRVIDFKKSRDSYYPIVAYSVNNQQYTYTSNTGSNIKFYDTGERVEVIYEQNNPQNSKINSFFNLWVGPFTLMIGGIFAIGGLYLFITKK